MAMKNVSDENDHSKNPAFQYFHLLGMTTCESDTWVLTFRKNHDSIFRAFLPQPWYPSTRNREYLHRRENVTYSSLKLTAMLKAKWLQYHFTVSWRTFPRQYSLSMTLVSFRVGMSHGHNGRFTVVVFWNSSLIESTLMAGFSEFRANL